MNLSKRRISLFDFALITERLIAITRMDAYPLPRVDDTLDTLAGSRLFTTLDLKNGYWQVEVEEADRQKTAFNTSEGPYHFNMMPFGLCNASATTAKKCVESNLDFRLICHFHSGTYC